MRLSSILCILILVYSAGAQEQVHCNSQDHRAFDFWVGEWNVYDTNGTQVGTNTIRVEENGCLITERWIGKKGLNGRSINHYDATTEAWRQVWVDSRGGSLYLTGGIVNGSMVMQDEPDASGVYNQITWKPIDGNEVHQVWLTYDGKGSYSTAFHGVYRSK